MTSMQKSGSAHAKVEVLSNGVQDMLPPNMAPWRIEYFKLECVSENGFFP